MQETAFWGTFQKRLERYKRDLQKKIGAEVSKELMKIRRIIDTKES